MFVKDLYVVAEAEYKKGQNQISLFIFFLIRSWHVKCSEAKGIA